MHPKPPSPLRQDTPWDLSPRELIAQAEDRPVVARARNHAAGHVITRHSHVRDQLLYATQGVMTIRALDSIWTVPPSFGLLVPAHVEHELRMDTQVEMRTLYFKPGVLPLQTGQCQLRTMTPLLRALIVRAMQIPTLYTRDSADARIMQVIIDEIGTQESLALSLRLPSDKRLLELCLYLLEHLDVSDSVRTLGARVGLSERSVLRLFPRQTGVTFQTWRQHARLMRAFVLAQQQWPIKSIASELGYGSSAAFAKMFRKVFACSPRQLLKDSSMV